MNFLYPIGLVGLVAVPILIIIYILKSKYKESTIASTYIWELSEKFMKKKSPLSKLNGLLSLILQILTVIMLSFTLAHPVLTVANSARNYLFVLDQSASMNIETDSQTRFEIAKNTIVQMINDSKTGSKFSIILSDDEPHLIVENDEDKENVIARLTSLSATSLPVDDDYAISLAQNYFTNDPSLNVYLLTDKDYVEHDNIEVINVAKENDYNASLNECNYSLVSETQSNFYGSVTSYVKDNEIEVELYLDDVLDSSTIVDAKADEETQFEMVSENVSFSTVRIVLKIDDDLSIDNEYVIYANESVSTYNVLLVSDNPFYIRSMLNAFGGSNIKTVSTSSYVTETGYDLYVFDGYSPNEIPSDGTVWLFGTSGNIRNSGFTVQGNVEVDGGAALSLSRYNSTTYMALSEGITANNFIVREFYNYSLVSNFSPILQYKSYPMVFAGDSMLGNREVVFSFDLHDSNLPLTLDYILLFRNIINYSIPTFCEATSFVCGEDLVLNVLPNCESIRVNTPSGFSTYLTLDGSVATYTLNEIGTYKIEARIGEQDKEYQIFVQFPSSERNTLEVAENASLEGSKQDVSYDSLYDGLVVVFILLMVLCLIEWGVYCYEQH